MEVGEDEAALVEDHARAQTWTAELRTTARPLGAEELLEEILEEGVLAPGLRARGARSAGLLDGAEVDHRGAHVLGDTGETRLQALDGRQARGGPRGGCAAFARHWDDAV